MWLRVRRWLNNTPITDPTDQHYASFMQLLLAAVGIVIPIIRLTLFVSVLRGTETYHHDVTYEAMDLGTDALMTASAWIGIFLIRRGYFRQALMQFLSVLLGTLALAYMTVGVSQLAGDPTPWIALALAGQVMGRRALWVVYLALLTCVTLGVWRDGLAPAEGGLLSAAMLGAARAMIFLVIAIIVDQTMAPLRVALTESQWRQRELADLNANLAQEIVMREKAQDHLIHAQKLEAVGRIATGVAHDFDNVLNVVLGYAAHRHRLAERGMPAVMGAMEDIELLARRALSISRKLLNFGRKDVVRSETFDAAVATHELQPMLRQFFAANTCLQLEVQPSGLTIRMDRGQFELMLLNMASNAADAMPQGGKFTIRLQQDIAESTLALVVQDTGSGMSDDVRQRIFEPFYTTKSWGYGTGLGLSAVHDIVSAAGGGVTVDSTLGEGTIFHLRLPLIVPALVDS